MDIIKKILCFSLLGDLLFFDKKSRQIEETSLINKVYRINGMVFFVMLCALVIMYALLLIPVVNILILIILIILIYIYIVLSFIYILARNILLLVGYNRLDLSKFEDEEVKYLKLLRINTFLVLALYTLIPIGFIFILIAAIMPVYLLSLFLQVMIVLFFVVVGIIKIVFYVISRFKLYSVIKLEEF